MQQLQEDSQTIALMVQRYIETDKSQFNGEDDKWQEELQRLLRRQALTCVAVSCSVIINLYFSENISENKQELKQLMRSTKNALTILQDNDELVFHHAWALGSQVIKFCEMALIDTK